MKLLMTLIGENYDPKFVNGFEAGTAVQQSAKCSLVQRLAIILAMLLLCAVFCQGQRQQDTVKVVLLVSATAHYYNEYMQLQTCETNEGQIDPYHDVGYVSKDYWVHILYLDDKKQPIKPTLIVWQSVSAKRLVAWRSTALHKC